MSQADKTAKNRAKLCELCKGADVPVDYLCFLTHNMRARLVRYINSNEQSRACSLIRKWYENEDAQTERRHKVLRQMQRDRQERQRRLTAANIAASSSSTQVPLQANRQIRSLAPQPVKVQAIRESDPHARICHSCRDT